MPLLQNGDYKGRWSFERLRHFYFAEDEPFSVENLLQWEQEKDLRKLSQIDEDRLAWALSTDSTCRLGNDVSFVLSFLRLAKEYDIEVTAFDSQTQEVELFAKAKGNQSA